MTSAHPTLPQDSAGAPRPPVRYRLLTPTDWFRIALRDEERRHRSVRALIDRTVPTGDERAAQRRELRETLTTVADEAAAKGGVDLYVSTQAVLGLPLPATLLITGEPGDPDPPGEVPVERMAGSLRARHGEEADVSTLSLPSGEAVRCRRQGTTEETRELGRPAERPSTLLDFYLPVPGSGGWLILTFCAPIPELAEAQIALFDAVAGSLRWSPQAAAPGSEGARGA